MVSSLFSNQQTQQQTQQNQPQLNQNLLSQIKTAANAIDKSKNPTQFISMLAQQNPIVKNVMAMVNGRNPRDVFFDECKRQNIDPNTILNMLK